MRFRLTAVNGTALNPNTLGFAAEIEAGGSGRLASAIDQGDRTGRGPYRIGARPQAVDRRIVCWKTDPTLSIDGFRARVAGLFRPYGGLLTLTAQRADGTTVSTQGEVTELDPTQPDGAVRVTVRCYDPLWYGAEVNASPGSITVAGNTPVRPTITISGGAPVNRYRVTVRDRFGQGLAGYPLAISLGQGWNPADVTVIHGLRPVPFYLDSGRGLLWVRVDVPAGGAAIVDVFHGEAVANGITAQALDLGTLDPTQSTATTWVYPQQTLWRANRAHGGTGSFTVGRSIVHTATGMTFGWSGSALRVAPDDYGDVPYAALPNDYDSLVLVSGVPMTSITLVVEAFSGFPRLLAESLEEWLGHGGVRLSCRAPGEETWQAVNNWWFADGSPPQIISGTYQLGGAVEVALGVFGLPPVDRPAKFPVPKESPTPWPLPGEEEEELQDGTRHMRPFMIMVVRGDWTVRLDPDRVPAVDISEPVDAQRLDVVLRNQTTGDFVQLSEVYLDRVALTIDPNSGQVTPTSGVPPVGREILFGDAANLFTLAPGTNTVTATGADVSLTYRPGWAL